MTQNRKQHLSEGVVLKFKGYIILSNQIPSGCSLKFLWCTNAYNTANTSKHKRFENLTIFPNT